VLAGDTVVAAQVALGLVPEVLDAVDVVALVGEQPGVVDAHVVELGDVEHIVAAEGIGVDHAVGSDLLADDRNKRVRTGICDDCDMDLALPLEQPEHRHLASRPASTLALAVTAKVALVHLDLASQQLGGLGCQGIEDHLAQLVIEQDRGVAVDAGNLGRRTRRRSRAEILDQFFLHTPPKTAPAPHSNHMTYIALIDYLCQPLTKSAPSDILSGKFASSIAASSRAP
jgi:hypothetical protein